MKQINNGYDACYYLLRDGSVYREDTDVQMQPNSKHQYSLKTIEGKYKSISLRSLYKLVYDEIYSKDDIEDLEGELWKEIEDTNKLYYVSNKGRIKSLQGYDAMILNPYKTSNGYRRVDIVQEGKRVSKLVHRLTAAAWLPLPKSIDHQLHHKDFNKDNNAADNLEWLSCQDHANKHTERSKDNG